MSILELGFPNSKRSSTKILVVRKLFKKDMLTSVTQKRFLLNQPELIKVQNLYSDLYSETLCSSKYTVFLWHATICYLIKGPSMVKQSKSGHVVDICEGGTSVFAETIQDPQDTLKWAPVIPLPLHQLHVLVFCRMSG